MGFKETKSRFDTLMSTLAATKNKSERQQLVESIQLHLQFEIFSALDSLAHQYKRIADKHCGTE